jgi:uncharacterized protein (TIGR02646 family)
MVHTKRIPAQLDFIEDEKFKAKLEKEYNDAKTHFTAVQKDGKFGFECYKNPKIKSKLTELFHGKCAYCDTSLIHITAGDIEHFRPKSTYWWWLASDWDNLLFACEKCNRSGKNDAFPLLNDAKPISQYDDPKTLAEEDNKLRLLLNPCKENPELFFDYDDNAAIIRPKTTIGVGTKEREMAENSIRVYNLQRHELVQEREKLLILLLAQIDSTKKVIDSYNALTGETDQEKKFHELRMEKELKKLLEYNKPNRSYLGLVRQILRKFFMENDIKLPKYLEVENIVK